MLTSIESLFIYGLTFALSLFFIYCAQIKLDVGRSGYFKFYSLIGILIPCMLAGLRNESVGTDVLVYAKTAFTTYQNTSLQFVLTADTTKTEVGYNILAFISSKFTDKLGGFLFLIQLFVMVPIYVVLTKNRKENGTSICIGMFVYYCLFFGQSLSIMRQSIASAFLLWGVYEFRTHKIRGIFVTVIAFFFHSSVAIAAPLICAIWYLTSSKRNKYIRFFSVPVIAFLCAAAFTQWQLIFQWLIDKGIVSSRYAYYLAIIGGRASSESFYSITLYNLAEVMIKLFLAVMCIIVYKNKFGKEDGYQIKQYIYQDLFASAFSIIVMILMGTYYGYRLSMYLEYGLMLIVPSFAAGLSPKEKHSLMEVNSNMFFLIMACIAYFLIVYIIGHLFGVVPYKFA